MAQNKGKDNALNLAPFIDKSIRVKISGGREGGFPFELDAINHTRIHRSSPCVGVAVAVQGTLKGYDQLLNLVLDEAVEYLRGDAAPLPTPRPPPSIFPTST
jgi:U6 snRNA-associated Sm-like protein LSm7